ncbi:hypothetical protein EXIGLDRAFT_698156 [Exidia glandulosa HHB12029]|uniref:Uncharacterized protein n=1 Tax=Exidia glandulosa HHB12029 TaxID=1314781 RepID=A0A165EET0_EXIGL|nr:hypothetical protein EXIGLDRAFT_698156 [Exidia glandulosa HHB12029]
MTATSKATMCLIVRSLDQPPSPQDRPGTLLPSSVSNFARANPAESMTKSKSKRKAKDDSDEEEEDVVSDSRTELESLNTFKIIDTGSPRSFPGCPTSPIRIRPQYLRLQYPISLVPLSAYSPIASYGRWAYATEPAPSPAQQIGDMPHSNASVPMENGDSGQAELGSIPDSEFKTQ